MALAIANRYARALADAVMAPGSGLDPVAALGQLSDFAATVQGSADLRNVLMSPAVAAARKRAVATRLAEPLGLHKLMRNLVFVVLDHRRVSLLGEIVAAFQAVLDERLGRVRAQVVSAATLSSADQERLQSQLARLTGKHIRTEFAVDPELLGGVSVSIGSTIYDGSVRGQLAALRQRLASHS